jgi:hypothetical protein
MLDEEPRAADVESLCELSGSVIPKLTRLQAGLFVTVSPRAEALRLQKKNTTGLK